MRKIIWLMILFVVVVGCENKTPHTYAEVEPYLNQISEIMTREGEIRDKFINGSISASSVVEQKEKLLKELKQIKPSWEFKEFHAIKIRLTTRDIERYKLIAAGKRVPSYLKNELHDLSAGQLGEMVVSMKKLRK